MIKHYFINRGRGEEGPFTIDELSNMRLLDDTKVWYEGLIDWKNINDVTELSSLVIQRPPIIERTKDTQTNVNKQIHKSKYLKKKSLIYLLLIIIGLTISSIAVNSIFFQPDPVSDIDGNVSSSVKIGSPIWMDKNLDVSQFRNGDMIPQAKTDAEWKKAGDNKQPAWCYYDNDPANGNKYGKLYNWYAVIDPRGLAPKGWHIPSKNEWNSLDYWGDKGRAKLKSTSDWKDAWNNDRNGTNSSGFNDLPGGSRMHGGEFINIGSTAYWWSSTNMDGIENAYFFLLGISVSTVDVNIKSAGMSVRCIKD